MSSLSMSQKKQPLPDQYAKEMQELWSKKDQLSPDEQDALLKVRDKLAQNYEVPDPENGLSAALHKVSGALAYPAGIVRTAAASALQAMPPVMAAQYLLKGKLPYQDGSLVSGQDIENALEGHAQTGEDIVGKTGVPDAAKAAAQLLGTDPSTASSVGKYIGKGLGMGVDFATDPATWAGAPIEGMSNGILKTMAETAANPIGKALSSGGKSFYNGAFKDAMQTIAEKQGKDPQEVLDWLWNNRIWGAKGGQMKQVQGIIDPLKAEKQKILASGLFNGADYYFKPSDALTEAEMLLARQQNSAPGALESLNGWRNSEAKLAQLKDMPQSDLESLIDQQNMLHDSAYPRGESTLTDGEQAVLRKAYNGRQQEIENAFNQAGPGLGDKLSDVNSEMSTAISAKDAIDANKSYFHPVDPVDAAIAGAGGLGAVGHVAGAPEIAGGAYALKKAYDFANTPLGRTSIGLGMHQIGRAVPYANDLFYEQTQPDVSANPWASVPQRRLQ